MGALIGSNPYIVPCVESSCGGAVGRTDSTFPRHIRGDSVPSIYSASPGVAPIYGVSEMLVFPYHSMNIWGLSTGARLFPQFLGCYPQQTVVEAVVVYATPALTGSWMSPARWQRPPRRVWPRSHRGTCPDRKCGPQGPALAGLVDGRRRSTEF